MSVVLALILCHGFLPEQAPFAVQQQPAAPRPVKVTAQLGPLNETNEQTLTVTLEIDKGWHIYAHKPGIPGLIGTTVTTTAEPQLQVLEVKYPEGTEVRDEVLNATYRQYAGATQIQLRLRRVISQGKRDVTPLSVLVRFQCCNEKTCLPPQTLKLNVGK